MCQNVMLLYMLILMSKPGVCAPGFLVRVLVCLSVLCVCVCVCPPKGINNQCHDTV